MNKMVKKKNLYKDLAKRLEDYSDEPSRYKKQKMLLSIDGKLGYLKKNGKEKEAMALCELRKIMRRMR